MVEAGVTFFQLAAYLHDRGASVGYTLTNWNISLAAALRWEPTAPRSASPRWLLLVLWLWTSSTDSAMSRHLERDETNDDWLAASTSLGLLGIIARIKLKIYPDTKVYAKQDT